MVAHNCHGKTKNLSAKTKTSRQNQQPNGENKIPHGKTKNLTAKPNTSRQNQIVDQILHSKSKIALVLPWVFAFAVRYLVSTVKYLVLSWGFCFCREVFGFTARFLFLPWGILFLPWGFWFCQIEETDEFHATVTVFIRLTALGAY